MFNENTQETPAQEGGANTQSNVQTDDLNTLLSSIVNERGEQKYKSPAEALRALQHSQAYIPQLKQENQAKEQQLSQIQQELQRMRDLEDAVQQLTQRQQQTSTQAPAYDEEKIAALLDKTLTQRTQQQVAQANKATVESTLRQQFGEKAGEVFYGKAKEMNISAEDIQALAAKSPQAALALFGVSGSGVQKPNSQVPPRTALNTAATMVTPPDSYIGRETITVPIGGGAQYQKAMMENARKMVTELHEKGMTVDDLTIPANYRKYIKGYN